jgi:hypothetical protein
MGLVRARNGNKTEQRTMRLRHIWAMVALAALAQGGAAFADVTVSHSNSPDLGLPEQIATLMGAEHAGVGAVSNDRLAALATGPSRKKKGAVPLTYTDSYLQRISNPAGNADWQCLKTALYFEARGETLKGQFAVAEVILNRVDSGKYPPNVCGVVQQSGGGGCQFSYSCDGRADVMRDKKAADRAGRIARVMLDGAARPLTEGATHFHTRAVAPGWADRFARTASIGAHLFYRQP